MEVTTQDLFLRLGRTSRTRSAKADALFRRLRFDREEQVTQTLSRAPRRLEAGDFDEALKETTSDYALNSKLNKNG